MIYVMEKFVGNLKMMFVCFNYKLNKNVQLLCIYYFLEILKFWEEDYKLYFIMLNIVLKNIRV